MCARFKFSTFFFHPLPLSPCLSVSLSLSVYHTLFDRSPHKVHNSKVTFSNSFSNFISFPSKFNFSIFFFSSQELYRIIESHARLVGACTRSSASARHQTAGLATSIAAPTPSTSATENHSLNAIDQQLATTIATGQVDDENCFSSLETQTTRRSHGSSSECNLKGLERRYHSLYLKAFEVKLLLENLLERKNEDDDSQVSLLFTEQKIPFFFSELCQRQSIHTTTTKKENTATWVAQKRGKWMREIDRMNAVSH